MNSRTNDRVGGEEHFDLWIAAAPEYGIGVLFRQARCRRRELLCVFFP
jgi:hypothetical protein